MVDNAQGKFGRFFLQELHDNSGGSPEFREMYKKFASRILWIDDDVMPGAIQMNTAWYFGVPELDPVFEEHEHEYDELIGFFGSDPSQPYDLGATMEITLGGETHRVTKTTLIYVPAGMKHMPLSIKEVRRPVFHFSLVVGPKYNNSAYK